MARATRIARSVTVIPATINPATHLPTVMTRKRRVAGYARVSTDSEEQLTSYEAQVDYYTKYIQSKPDWEFVKVYTDEGISAVNTKRREGFNQMVEDALAGRIDLIVTKSVSRFARNTVDSLTTVRKLKEAGVEIYFEKENIWTMDSKGELLITIMSSLAQEESRSISENVTWGQRKRFADGKISLPYKHFLGYRKGANDLPEIVEEEADIVRQIYRFFMIGKTVSTIAKMLTAMQIPTPSGKIGKWSPTTVESILTNEKYKGDALLQKSFTTDFLTKKMKVNEGEVPQYYVENSHPAIIAPEEFDAVQAEFQRRKNLGRRYSGQSVLSARIVCSDCGDYYGSKVWHSNTKYRRTVWQCNSKFGHDHHCQSPTLDEEDVKARFLVAYNSFFEDRTRLIEDARIMQDALTNCEAIDAELEELGAELSVIAGLMRKCIDENASAALDQEDYMERYQGLAKRHETTYARYQELEAKREARLNQASQIGGFLFELMERDEPLTEFDDRLWLMSLDKAIAFPDGHLVFKFQNGLEICA